MKSAFEWAWSVWLKLVSTLSLWWRSTIKGTLRRATGLCELQRACYGEKPGAPRASAVETSLALSRNSAIRATCSHLDSLADDSRLRSERQRAQIFAGATAVVLRVKRIDPRAHPDFPKAFETCARHVWGYRQLRREVELLRRTPYDSDDPSHERRLLELWNALVPNEPLAARVTKQWQNIGFQGDDPKTDFRGMGLLGLENLLYFAKRFSGAAGHVLSHSNHPKYGYTFAVVGINLTSMAYSLLKDGSAKTYVYNAAKDFPSVETFHKLYCYLFYEFDRYWIESKPRDMMEFTHIQQRFEANVRNALKNKTTLFRINIKVDNV